MVIDVGRCVGCYNCFLACRDEHAGNDHTPVAVAQPESGHRWIDIHVREQGSFPVLRVSYTPVPCLHCQDAPCMSAARDGAIRRRADGIVLIDPNKATGQRGLVEACPYGAIYWNKSANTAQKCTFCAHLLDQSWKQPRCVEVCPTQALIFGDLEDPTSEVAKQAAMATIEDLRPDFHARPLVRYLNLPTTLVTGEVVLADQPDLPAPGIQVTVRRDAEVRAVTTDSYGDFEFKGLTSKQQYLLLLDHPGYAPRELKFSTSADVNLGAIILERL